MITVSITQVRKNIFDIFAGVLTHAQEVLVSTKKGNVILVSEQDWNSLQETLYLQQDKQLMKEVKAYAHHPAADFQEVQWADIT